MRVTEGIWATVFTEDNIGTLGDSRGRITIGKGNDIRWYIRFTMQQYSSDYGTLESAATRLL